MIKIGVVIEIPSISEIVFKVFDEYANEIQIGNFITLEIDNYYAIGKIVRIYRRNYLPDEKIVGSIDEKSLTTLKNFGIDIEYLTTATFAKALIIGIWNGSKIVNIRKPPRLYTFVYIPNEEFIEQILKPRDENVYVEVGYVKGFENIKAYLNADKLVTHHCAILAATGGGKSWLAGVLIEELFYKTKTPIIVIDPHSEYSAMQVTADRIGIKLSDEELKIADEICSNVEVYIPGKVDVSTFNEYFKKKFGIERRYIRFGISPTSLPLSIIVKLLDYYYGITDTQKRILEESWNYIYFSYCDELIELDELINEIERFKHVAPKGYAGEISISSLVTKIKSLIENRPFFLTRYGEYFRDEPIKLLDVRKLIEKPSIKVFDLGGLDIIDQQALVAVILDSIMRYATKRITKPIFIIIEEAHNFAPSKGDAISLPSILRIAREGRKFGIGLCIISQRPARIHPDVLSQCMTQIFKRIINPTDLKYVKEVIEHTSIEDILEVKLLNEDEAIITGLATPIPLSIKVRKRYTAHGGLTPSLKEYLTQNNKSGNT